jgi:hypothetical protein
MQSCAEPSRAFLRVYTGATAEQPSPCLHRSDCAESQLSKVIAPHSAAGIFIFSATGGTGNQLCKVNRVPDARH